MFGAKTDMKDTAAWVRTAIGSKSVSVRQDVDSRLYSPTL